MWDNYTRTWYFEWTIILIEFVKAQNYYFSEIWCCPIFCKFIAKTVNYNYFYTIASTKLRCQNLKRFTFLLILGFSTLDQQIYECSPFRLFRVCRYGFKIILMMLCLVWLLLVLCTAMISASLSSKQAIEAAFFGEKYLLLRLPSCLITHCWIPSTD